MLVFDTSAYINGQRDHLKPTIFPSVWRLVAESIEAGTIILPREVFRELLEKDDDLASWIRGLEPHVAEPGKVVQRLAGEYLGKFPKPGIRNVADPFVLAEAKHRTFTVVTYEGRSFDGIPTKNWAKTMPGVCKQFGIPCCTLPEALERLGGAF